MSQHVPHGPPPTPPPGVGPTHPGCGPPGPGSPPERHRPGRRGLLIGGVAATLALLLCAGAGAGVVVAWRVLPTPQPDHLAVVWSTPAPPDRRDLPRTYATWVGADVVVRATADGVRAYRLADGDPAWTVPLPDGERICAAAIGSSGHHGVFAHGGHRCDRIGVVDLRSGERTVTVRIPLPEYAAEPPRGYRLLAAGEVAVFDDEATITAVGLGDGTIRWRQEKGDCAAEVYAMSAERVLMDRRCLSGEGTYLVGVDPATGESRFEALLGQRTTVQNVVSVDPVVAVVNPTRSPDVVVATFDPQGRRTVEIPVRAPGRALDFASTSAETGEPGASPSGMVVRDGVLFAVNQADRGRVAAFDLTDGTPTWTQQEGDGQTRILRVDDRGVWVTRQAAGSTGLVLVEAGTGAATLLGRGLPEEVGPSTGPAFEHDGYLVLTAGPRPADREPLVVVARWR
ncbi:PQQ-binding-like beta-propeller repeat protein [Micromonospora sp. NPDC000207]|uniref:outer membrane protein assembly factor BamB family protein n=1 Tax=Micromonospora sp. NPDC000207 TaxID=3154246 RepID=UPI0033165F3F